MELSPSRKTSSCAATQELTRILWNLKVYCYVYKNPPLVPVFIQISPIKCTSFYLSKIHLNIIPHPCLGLSNDLFPSICKLKKNSPHRVSKDVNIRISRTIILHVVLYGCRTWSLTLMEEHRYGYLRTALRRIYEPKGVEVSGGWRKLRKGELHNA
jgi:hypothetical protein